MHKPQYIADKAAITLSTVCSIHCLAAPVLLVMLPSLTAVGLGDESFHYWMLVAVIPCSVIALGLGCKKHRNMQLAVCGGIGLCLLLAAALFAHDIGGEFAEKALTLLGAGMIAIAHIRNQRLCRTLSCGCHSQDKTSALP